MSEVQEILQELGYRLRPEGNGWRAASLYRNGDNPTSLKVFQDGSFIDFVTNETGNFNKLIGLTTGCDPNKYLKNKQFVPLPKVAAEPINQPSSYPTEYLKLLKQDFTYPLSRGISQETLSNFRCGVMDTGKLANRFVFPIINSAKVVGFAGRALFKTDMKWKNIGRKKFFLFPLYVNSHEIQKKQSVVLVESIFDCLALYEAGVRNAFVTFGLNLSPFQIMNLARLGIKSLTIAFNNDKVNLAGNNAAEKLKNNLSGYFGDIRIVLPHENDWNEELVVFGKEKICQWFLRN